MTDTALGNAQVSLQPGETATFFLRAILNPDEKIFGYNMGITAPDTSIANLGATTLENPTVPLAVGGTGMRSPSM